MILGLAFNLAGYHFILSERLFVLVFRACGTDKSRREYAGAGFAERAGNREPQGATWRAEVCG